MTIWKKSKLKKCEDAAPAGISASGLSMLMGAGRTVLSEESAMHREKAKIRLDVMKADLRLHNALDLAEVRASRASAELQDYLAGLAKKAVRK